MENYSVTGMSCAACSARVEKAVSKVDGVTSCSVNLLTNSMIVEGSAKSEAVIQAVEKAGYGAEHLNGNIQKTQQNSEQKTLNRSETFVILKRLIISVVLLMILMYFSMGHIMWGWPLPEPLEQNHIAIGLIQLLLSGIIMVINQKFFINGFKGLIHGSPNMDTLVSLGSGASFIYSTYALFAMTFAQMNGDMHAVHDYMHEFYFESAAMILTLITVGKMLESYSKGKTTNAIKGLMELAPKVALVEIDGSKQVVPIENVRRGDIFVVRAGENIPVDGVIIEGESAIDESALTGESIPIDKGQGDLVSAGTISKSGYIRCEATKVGEDTTLASIIRMVNDASASKAPIAKIADKVSGVFVPIVMGIALITIVIWLIAGESIGFALGRGISVLVISCPCALGLATPVAIMVGNGVSARNGILFKTAESLENTGRIQIVALDKTGTITQGKPQVTEIFTSREFSSKISLECSSEKLLEIAYALESKSEHPIATAIIQKALDSGCKLLEVTNYKTLSGNGIKGTLQDEEIFAGNMNLAKENLSDKILSGIQDKYYGMAQKGITPVIVGMSGKLLGIIGVSDVVRDDSRDAIKSLKKMGIHTVMLTGDNRYTAEYVANQVGVDEVISEVLPGDKEATIQALNKKGRVAMVGDGINDAPALTSADIGIAIGAGTDIAIDAAQVVLMKNSLNDVAAAIHISKKTLRNIKENLFWAFIYNMVGIPLAAGLFYNALGWELNPMFGAAAMSLSSFCVVMNALRLNLIKVYPNNIVNNTKNNKSDGKERKVMAKIMKIEGMMCGHCEARVKKTLEGIEGVKEAIVDHTTDSAKVIFSQKVNDDILVNAVEAQDYKVISIEDAE